MPKCKICFKKYVSINNFHLGTHEITTTEYKNKYGVKYLHGKNIIKEIVKRNAPRLIAFNQSPEKIKRQSIRLKGNKLALGNKHSTSFKKRFSERMSDLWKNPKHYKKMVDAAKRKHHSNYLTKA